MAGASNEGNYGFNYSNTNSKYQRRGERHPPHLRGRDIGLFYASRPKSKWKHQRQHVSIDLETMEQLKSVTKNKYQPRNDESVMNNDFKLQYEKMLKENHFIGMKDHMSASPSTACLSRDRDLDLRLKNEMKNVDPNCAIQNFRRNLPAFKLQREIVTSLRENRILVISGETGCGKTTQVAQFILDDYIERGEGSLCSIACTQPRRISAISVAERVAAERGMSCGGFNSSVGYQIRLEAVKPRSQGSILFCTPGILLQWLQTNELLSETSHIILDEVHERDINTDFLIIILRELLRTRLDLHVILMSATLNAEQFSAYFDNCPMINIPGFTYHVQEFFLEDAVQDCGYSPNAVSTKRINVPGPKWKKYTKQGHDYIRKAEQEENETSMYLQSIRNRYSSETIDALRNMDVNKVQMDLFHDLIKFICRTKPNDGILVFLTGWAQINDLHQLLSNDHFFKSSHYLLIPLHSMMPTINQRQVFDRPPAHVRKIVLATNIAETSITIDDIVYVIDCGRIKISDFDDEKNLATLTPQLVSLANSKQRRGRAGRVQPGVCYHLYTYLQHTKLKPYLSPEMLRTRLEEVCLRIKILRLGRISPFLMKALDPPSPQAVQLSISLLQNLQALNEDEQLTPLGFHLARLPMDPQIGKMILFASIFSCLDPILTVAASMTYKEAFIIPLGKEPMVDEKKAELANGSKSDHIALINAVKGWERAAQEGRDRQFAYDHFLSNSILKLLVELKKQLADYLVSLKFLDTADISDSRLNKNSDNLDLIKAVICAGLYPNVIRCKNKKQRKHSLSDHRKQNTWKGLPKTHTRNESVCLHPKSVNSKEKYFDSPWLVYHQKIKSTQIFIHDCTMVTPFQLLFFGGKIQLIKDEGEQLVTIDDWISFKCLHSTGTLVKNLRDQLDNFLAYKIQNPGMTIWEPSENHFPVLKSIVDLITSQDPIENHQELDDN